ncbi:hypothetical protein N3K66_002684 [Trichothecium roseum]|uniref:Uncharacterized protein n=1 Tax=Trichothecium roseum TaxID=47278 RepID=A0ACC0VAB6_9HYPO|nr:hypothetical protein N3K66_002684 [Trichothecium roseum]
MGPPAKKRRTRADYAASAAETEATEEPANVEVEKQDTDKEAESPKQEAAVAESAPAPAPTSAAGEEKEEEETAKPAQATATDRMARFKALQARAKSSSESNMKEVTLESQRLSQDPSQLTAIRRKHAIASHKLMKADAEEAGEDFERKRAWDWTVDESERWDRRMKKKEANRDNNAFQDYQAESNKIYKRQLQNIDPDMDKYAKDKMAAIEKAAAAGGLDIVEMEDGELIAIDKDGSFYSTADSTTFTQNKPDKAAVDRLVADMRRADEQRLKKRKERMAKNGDEGDVTYINEKNKQFNQKLARFYDKYTGEIRDSFERGTMI